MHIRLLPLLSASLLLGGCFTLEPFQENLDRLYGKPSSAVVAALGYPDSTSEVGDEVVYQYGNSGSSTTFMSQTDYNTGAISMTPYTVGYSCNLKIIIDNGFVRHWEYRGDYTGCEPYMERLNSYFSK